MADMYAQYQSAMDPRRVRKYILNLDKFPQKVLAFDQQARPPYTGTFSKPSVVVGPRTPFQCDPLFDYSYDSGDDWMDEEGGDDVNDQDPEAEGDEDNSGSEEEDEFDDWLDDTEDALFGPDADGDVPMVGGRATDLPNAPSVPNAPDDLVAKRKIPVKRIAKLVQDCLGPFWENEIGKHPKDDWNLYRIKLLNGELEYTSR
jgi:hypothetical protein